MSPARVGRRPRQIPVQPCRIDQISWMMITQIDEDEEPGEEPGAQPAAGMPGQPEDHRVLDDARAGLGAGRQRGCRRRAARGRRGRRAPLGGVGRSAAPRRPGSPADEAAPQRPRGAADGAAERRTRATRRRQAARRGCGRGRGRRRGRLRWRADAAPGGAVDAARQHGRAGACAGGGVVGAPGRRPAARSATRSATRYTRSAPSSVGLRVTAVDARAPAPGNTDLTRLRGIRSVVPPSSSPGASGAAGALPLLTGSNDRLAGQRRAVAGSARRRCRVRRCCRCPRRSFQPARSRIARASFWPRPTTSGTARLGAALEVARVRRRQRQHRLALQQRLHRAEPGLGRGLAAEDVAARGRRTAHPAPSHRGRGEFELSNVITAPAICGHDPDERRRLVLLGGAGLARHRPVPAHLPRRARRGAAECRPGSAPVISVFARPGLDGLLARRPR